MSDKGIEEQKREEEEIRAFFESCVRRRPRKGYQCIGLWKGEEMWVTGKMYERIRAHQDKVLKKTIQEIFAPGRKWARGRKVDYE